jgi:hypothetical protein
MSFPSEQESFAFNLDLIKKTENSEFWREENIKLIRMLFPEYIITPEMVEMFYEQKVKNAKLKTFFLLLAKQFFFRLQPDQEKPNSESLPSLS